MMPADYMGIYDSTDVRLTYRQSVRAGARLVTVVSLAHAALLYWMSDAWAGGAFSVTVISVAAYETMRDKRSFPVFLTGLLGMVVSSMFDVVHLSLRYGGYGGFDLLILCYTPMVVTAGRIGLRMKILLVLAFVAAFVALGFRPAESLNMQIQSQAIHIPLQLCRLINMVVTGLVTPVLLLHYFHVMAFQQSRIRELAERDVLTKLHNRRYAEEIIEETLARRPPASDFSVLSIALLDLDHFKQINDRYGHGIGDEALRHTSACLQGAIRTSDIACRWGGEEFLLLFPRTSEENATLVAEGIQNCLSRPFTNSDGQEMVLTATIGVAEVRSGESLRQLLARADHALYAGKLAGRNRVVRATGCVAISDEGPANRH
jgi:diguanylate cyclase (GGDEF)-like protein